MSKDGEHPIQPVFFDVSGTLRFKENRIVRYLLDEGPFDLSMIDAGPFDRSDREQFAQLIGYPVDSFLDLDYICIADAVNDMRCIVDSGLKIGSYIRLGPWCGRIVAVLTDDETGEKYARVKLLKHIPGVTEVHPLGDLKPATVEELEKEAARMKRNVSLTMDEILCK